MRATGPSFCLVLLAVAGRAHADEPRFELHVAAAAATPVVAPKSEQFGWGLASAVSPELRLAKAIGVEVAIGAVALSDGGASPPPGVADTGWGFAGFSAIGPRVRPFAPLAASEGDAFSADGLWISGGVGAGLTASLVRPVVRAEIGYDAEGGIVRAGPYVGFFQMVGLDDDLRPEDARVGMVGLHGSFGDRTPAPPAPPPKDTDGDGVADPRDRCVRVPEDKDGFEDGDGCPDTDDDHDGIPDVRDACRTEPEDKDGFEDDDGCPDTDDDHDGIPDARDACRTEPEDKDGFEDDDGCPDPDDDHDGVADAVDTCPREPETPNGVSDDDGCPDTEDLQVKGNRIVLDDRVHFPLNQVRVSVKSWALMRAVADFLVAHPEYRKIRVNGHTDDTGPDAFNLWLSKARAHEVRNMLVYYGVHPSRLEEDGFGESEPRIAAETREARTENRRVEFEILERDGGPQTQGSAP